MVSAPSNFAHAKGQMCSMDSAKNLIPYPSFKCACSSLGIGSPQLRI